MDRSKALFPMFRKPFFSRQNPLATLSQIESEMQRWMTELRTLPEEITDGADFAPQCDLKETKGEYIAKFDIPGIHKEDVKIEVEGSRLTVTGERKEEKQEKDERRFYSESYYGKFMRSFTLPSPIDEKKVEAQYENGVLTVKIPKSEVSKAKQIAVH